MRHENETPLSNPAAFDARSSVFIVRDVFGNQWRSGHEYRRWGCVTPITCPDVPVFDMTSYSLAQLTKPFSINKYKTASRGAVRTPVASLSAPHPTHTTHKNPAAPYLSKEPA